MPTRIYEYMIWTYWPTIPTPTVPIDPTQSERVPSFRPYRLYPGGPLKMLTPRKSVHPPQNETFASPAIEPTVTASWRVHARKWNWVPDQVQSWRDEDEVPIIPETGESSTTTPIPPLTQEPVHHIIPVLIARLVRHESRIDQLAYDQEVLPSSEA